MNCEICYDRCYCRELVICPACALAAEARLAEPPAAAPPASVSLWELARALDYWLAREPELPKWACEPPY